MQKYDAPRRDLCGERLYVRGEGGEVCRQEILLILCQYIDIAYHAVVGALGTLVDPHHDCHGSRECNRYYYQLGDHISVARSKAGDHIMHMEKLHIEP